MKKFLLAVIINAVLSTFNNANAQEYEFKNGYIFDQPYVDRISLDKAEKLVNIPGIFEPLMTFDWAKKKEQIKDKRIKRVGSRLVIEISNKETLSLKNFSTNNGNGELQAFKYLTSIQGYHIVGVVYGHDQPHFLLIADSGWRIYFVSTR